MRFRLSNRKKISQENKSEKNLENKTKTEKENIENERTTHCIMHVHNSYYTDTDINMLKRESVFVYDCPFNSNRMAGIFLKRCNSIDVIQRKRNKKWLYAVFFHVPM